MDNETDVEVVVVGAGPTGLLVASELALGGVSVQVIDRLGEPDPTVKAGSINVATAEVLDRRGLLPAARLAHIRMVKEIELFTQSRAGGGSPQAGRAAESGTPAGDQQRVGHDSPHTQPTTNFPVTGHFAAMFFRPDLVDRTDPELRAHTAIDGATLVPQRDVEAILAEHAAALGVAVKRGVEVTGLCQDDDAVTLQTSAGALRARWVVGADGGRSAIRKLAGIDFPGTEAETTGYQAIADLEGAEALQPGWTWSPNGVYSYGPIPGRILTVQFTGPPADRTAPVTAQEVQASIRRVSGADVTVTALHGKATRWTDNARQASTYRNGRILLAGDAAHVHSPFSGQGLNLGIGDAVNLGWKLAATIRGWAPSGLLDSYTAERHAIGAWVLDWTRAQVALMRGDAKTRRLRDVVQQQLLTTPEAMTRVVKLTSGIAQRHTLDGQDDAATVEAEGARAGGVGDLIGDVDLADGSRLADHAHRGAFVLLDRTPGHTLSRAIQPWHDRVVTVPDAEGDPAGLLVRPDGVVIWSADQPVDALDTGSAGSAGAPTDPSFDTRPRSLERALLQWAGPAGPE